MWEHIQYWLSLVGTYPNPSVIGVAISNQIIPNVSTQIVQLHQ